MERQEHRKTATPEKGCNTLRSVDEERKELRESIDETARLAKETERQVIEIDDPFSSVRSVLVDCLVDGKLVSLLETRGIAVNWTATKAKGTRGTRYLEYDILAANNEVIVVVEVGDSLTSEDVAEFLDKLAFFTTWGPEHKDKRVLGAVTYLNTDSSVILYAQRQGLYVIRANDSSASIINKPDFRPREFN